MITNFLFVVTRRIDRRCNNKIDTILSSGDEDDGSDGDSSVKAKSKMKGRKNDSRNSGRRKRVTKKYMSDDEDDVDDN